MRIAEFSMALVMAIFSVYLMWKSTELPIGWIDGEGPGGGAFPFWLALGMLICCAIIMYNWWRRKGPPSRSQEVFMDKGEVYKVSLTPMSTSNYFKKGHKIRIEVSSSNFPRFARNLNTGGNNYDEKTGVVATNNVHYSENYPSQIRIPVISKK